MVSDVVCGVAPVADVGEQFVEAAIGERSQLPHVDAGKGARATVELRPFALQAFDGACG
jgi:hypothetical protein